MDFAEYPSIGHALHPARNQTFTAHYGTKHVPFRYLFDENSPLISSPDDSALARYRLRGGVGRVGEYSRNATEGAFCAKKRHSGPRPRQTISRLKWFLAPRQ